MTEWCLAMNASRQTHSAPAFGLRWSSDLPLHGFGRTGADEAV